MKQYQIGTKKWMGDGMFYFRNKPFELYSHKSLPQEIGQVTEVVFHSRNWDTNVLTTKTFKVKRIK